MSGGFTIAGGWCNMGHSQTPLYATTGISNPSTPDVYGAWTQIVSALPTDIDGLLARFYSNGDSLIEIGIGAGGSEVVLLPDFMIGNSNIQSLFLPICLPAGTRIAFRARSHPPNNAPSVSVSWFASEFASGPDLQGFDSLGVTATSTGTALTYTTQDVRGAWTQLVASSASDYIGFYIRADDLNGAYSNVSTGTVSIGVGAAGSEVEVCNLMCFQGFVAFNFGINQYAIPYMANIPAGTRISAALTMDNGTVQTVGVSLVAIKG